MANPRPKILTTSGWIPNPVIFYVPAVKPTEQSSDALSYGGSLELSLPLQ